MKTNVPRWVILLIDLVIAITSFVMSYFITKEFRFSEILRGHFFLYTGLYGLLCVTVFYFMRIHTGIIRYSNIQDMGRIFLSVFIITLLYPLAAAMVVAGNFHIHSLDIPEVLVVNFFIASSLLIMFRTGVKGFYHYIKNISAADKENVLIYGSGREAILIKQAIESSERQRFVIAGFVDPGKGQVNTYIQQKRVYHIRSLGMLKNRKKIGQLIIMNHQPAGDEKKIVIEKCLQVGIKILTVPPPDQWVYGKLSLRQIQQLSIEDLLQRDPIEINNANIMAEVAGKRVLVTGAAGSIGSEIVRQVLSYGPEMVILCDQAESALHEVQLEMEERYPEACLEIFIASVRDLNRIQIPFREHRPHLVFHAAAYKHVPMMERHPCEAILTNVMGTKIISDLSEQYRVHKFIMISTDKAVNPSNVMGASKRIAEMYVQSLALAESNGKTRFITTRFGNVLGSNGSVIPRFRAQIEKGGPVTVTHPEINRFFMTIPEAVQLVLEAAVMGKGAEIFVFDMGRPVKIVDLARKMIRLAGLSPEEDIRIVFTGLRPGEKLYEELLNKDEKTLPTHHEKIKIARVRPCQHGDRENIEDLIAAALNDDRRTVVMRMKALIPEYVSRNSEFEELDNREMITTLQNGI